MYKTFTIPLKSAFFALAALFILTACGGFTIDINSIGQDGECSANPFLTECDNQRNISTIRQLVIDDCDSNPEKSNTRLCLAADAAFGARDAGGAADNTPKDILIKSEFDKDSLTKTDDEKIGIADLEIVDLCSDPATAHDKQCTPAVIDCINNPFSGSCQGDNVLGNFVRGAVTVSKTVVLQDKRAEDCRTGSIDRALCQNLNVQKQRCTGAAFSTDAICSAVAYSVCKADAFDPLCGEKENFAGVYFNERSEVCYAEPNNPNCTGASGHVAVVCSEYPFDRLCTGNTDYDDVRATACEVNPTVSSSCSTIQIADVCLDNPFGPTCADSDYNNARKELVKTCAIQAVTGAATTACDVIIAATGPCFKNPFDTTCDANPAVRSYIGQLRSNRVALCNSNLRVASYCTGVPVATPQVTASVWANSFTTPLATEATVDHLYNTESQFLIGRATDLDSGDVPSNIIRTSGNLNLADATFNGVALGGDRADGLAFLTDGALYSGILSGTNLGAPLTETAGTAKWIGSFQLAGYSPTDFVLNVSFGTGSGAGEIEALIQSYIYFSDHHIKGEFDDAGVITGTADTGFYRRNDPTNRREDVTNHYSPGKLTGLIGEEGAVGAFIIDNLYGVGGFVARPSSVAELQTLAQTCADDPFNKLCSIGYESERNAVLDHCIIGGNANDESCDSANDLDSCIKHPFRSSCEARLPDHYQQVRVNRLAFCRTAGNAGNELCTADTTFAHICTNYPFDAQCLGNDDYDQARQDACDTAGAGSTECRTLAGLTCSNDPFDARCGGAYNNARESACASNPNSSRCSDTLARVCGGNPFNRLCRNTQTYLNTRVSICRGNPADGRCGGIIAGVCGNNPFDLLCGSGYTQNRRNACSGDPFAPRCAGNVYNDLRVSFCTRNAGTHPSCPAPEPQVTAKVWADSFDTPLAHGATADDTESKFLIGRATDLDTGGVKVYGTPTNLNLADATFNGVDLGGDRADGVAFFDAGSSLDRGRYSNAVGLFYSYAGILSGTNLGAPLTDTEGSAKWIGSFKLQSFIPVDFVLNISFGTGDGAGEIEGLVQKYLLHDFHIKGEFDAAGVITGFARHGIFKRDAEGIALSREKLTGLIGEDGAVGAFILNNYFGGFVARPPSAAELRTLEQTCADDPFHKHCTIGYESERTARIEHCITDDNVNNDAICGSVKKFYSCINRPFFIDCRSTFPSHYEQARINRVAFCRTVGNAENALCTVHATFAHICTNYPFDAQCRGDNSYRSIRRDACADNPFATRCTGDAYNDLRVSFCEDNADNRACPRPDTTPNRVTTADWLASFDEDLPVRRRRPLNGRIGFPYIGENHFVKASETGLDLTNYIRATHKVITFANVTFDGKAVGGDAADGFALSFNSYAQHAGILADTDLGAPLTQRQGSASWNARMVVLANKSQAVVGDFILHINFGAGGQAGTITGQAIAKNYGVRALNGPDYRYRLDGEFDDSGVITGTSQFGNFKNRDTEIPKYGQNPGTLTGLIGEEGAIGAFISNRGGYTGYAGGFIATPSLQNYVSSADLDDYYHLTWPTDPLYRNETSSFLAVSATGEMNTGTLLTREGNTPTVETLTLANATYQGRALGGDATDGIAFFKGWKGPTDTLRSTKIHYRVYSGIFDDINLGAPVTETSGKAYWKGQFKSVHFDRVVSKDFTLEVSFSNRVRTAGRVDALVHDTGSKHFKVSASFNHRGVIDGRVIFGDYENNNRSAPHTSYRYADLVGLIGQEGAVAMFKRSPPPPSSSGRSPQFDFAGGFVAVPNLPDLPTPAPDTTPNRVTREDWLASFGTAPARVADVSRNHFVQTSDDMLGTDFGFVIDIFPKFDGFWNRYLEVLRGDDIPNNEGRDAADAVALYVGSRGDYNDESNSYFYAGILNGTDLGAPLSETSGTATWSGRFLVLVPVRGGVRRDFTLDITFNGTGGDISTVVNGRTKDYFELDGTFNDRGVISGTANHVYYENGRIGDATGDLLNSGHLSGIIGQEGAVGVFVSNRQTGPSAGSGFVGGFVARPPSE